MPLYESFSVPLSCLFFLKVMFQNNISHCKLLNYPLYKIYIMFTLYLLFVFVYQSYFKYDYKLYTRFKELEKLSQRFVRKLDTC